MSTHSSDPSRSAELFARAQHVLPGGVSRNTVLREPHPAYADSGAGCRVTDLDGITRIDFSNNMASLIHGHAYPPIVEAVSEQLRRGSGFMLATECEVAYAEHLCSRSPSFEKVRFMNSGTEAVMVTIKASRAFTGRPKIAKVEGAYHGAYDYAEVSQITNPSVWGDADRPNGVPVAHGTPAAALNDVIILPFNNTQRALELLDEHAEELACVLLDPMPHRVGMN
ncbi:MAG: aminotransferase class III-fold pyridoxal phosphate-dependent enzyme, partial [Planctomycetota bacterium]|nr:aminotransferase class III-fold pyridoxal phosphate-dependent enzyme [Planctomycetota bacterium]